VKSGQRELVTFEGDGETGDPSAYAVNGTDIMSYVRTPGARGVVVAHSNGVVLM
jgi:hypothetical protein